MSKHQIIRTIMLSIITLLLGILTVVLFNLLPNFESNSDQHILLIFGVVICGAGFVGCFITTMYSLFGDWY